MKYAFVLVVLAASLLVGCELGVQSPISPSPVGGDVQTFSSLEELEAFLASSGSSGGDASVRSGGLAVAESMAVDAPSSARLDFTGTNVQHADIDEADILKTDGEYVYTVSGRTLFVVRAYPGADAEVVSRVRLDAQPQGLFIDGDDLLVIGSSHGGYDYLPRPMMEPGFSMPRYWGGSSSSTIQVFDVSDKASPSLVSNASFEGSFVDARLRDGVAYMVFNSPVSAGTPLPLLSVDGVDRRVAASDVAYFPRPYDSPQLTTVQSFEFSSGSFSSSSVLSERSQHVYMGEHLVLASSRYVNEWSIRQDKTLEVLAPRASREVRDLLARVDAVDSDILSDEQKKQRKLQALQRWASSLSASEQDSLQDLVADAVDAELSRHEFLQYTDIVKLAVSAQGAEVVASGSVYGLVNNQFSFDEHDGVLRVATTTNAQWKDGEQVRDSENHVYALDERLEVLDHLSGIAPTERIFSARFVEDRLYLVTFRDIDPFFVIDLSNPRELEILGELKIEGFSRYLHPIDEDTVLGFGRDADSRGMQQGLKISLFDVSDVANPVERAQWVSDQRFVSSSAEFEHKAFLYDSANDLLVIPAYAYSTRGGEESYNGALVFSVTPARIELRGLVDHGTGERWSPSVERSFRIEELLYTKSPSLLRINQISDLSRVLDVELRGLSDTDMPIY